MTSADLLLVGAGVQGTPYVRAARELGVRVHLVETAGTLARLAGEVDSTWPVTGPSDEHWLAAAAAAAAGCRPGAVLGFNEPQVIAAALLQDELGLPGPGLRAATYSRNKALQRGRLAAAGVPQPPHVLVDDLAQARDWAAPRLPVVVKPLSNAGSAGVEQAADRAAFDRIAARRPGRRLLVEQMIEGPEYSWEGLLRDGVVCFANVTAKQTLGPPGFIEVGHAAGHRFPPAEQAAVDRLAAGVISGLGVRTGIVHLEFRMSARGPVFIEVAVRTPGDYLMDVVSLTAGVDLYEAVVRLAFGTAPAGLPVLGAPPVAYAASWMVVAEPGRIVRVEGLDEVRAHPHVVRARLRRTVGATVAPLRSSDDRVGHVLVSAPSAAARDAALAHSRATLRVVTTSAEENES